MPLLNSLLKDKGTNTVDSFTAEPQKVLNEELDHSLRYFFIFLFLGGGAAAWLSYVLLQFNTQPAPATFLNLSIVGVLLMVVMVFQGVLILSAQFNFLLVVVEAALLPTFFYQAFSSWFAIGIVLFAVMWLLGYSRARIMLANVMKINFWHYSAMMITTAITAIALFVSAFYVGVYYQQGGITFDAYKFVVGGATPGLQYVTPNFNPETKVDSFLDSTVRDYFGKQGDFNKMPSGSQQLMVKEASSGLLGKITDFTKVILQPGDTMISYTFRWVSELIKSAQEKGLGFLVVMSIFLVIFFSIKGSMFFIKWPVLAVCFVVYLLLQAVGVVSIGAEMRQKEVIIVK